MTTKVEPNLVFFYTLPTVASSAGRKFLTRRKTIAVAIIAALAIFYLGFVYQVLVYHINTD
jgi:hypothetical protein